MSLKYTKSLLMLAIVVFIFSFSITTAQTSSSYVDVLWQSDSYVPPFYQGKALKYGPATLKFVAIPEIYDENNKKINDSLLYYQWSLNSRILGHISGINIKSVNIATSLRNDTIGVAVLSKDKTITYARGSVLVKNTNPEVLIYYKDPLLGIMFNNIVSNDFVSYENEITFVAYPLFFNVISNNSSKLEYIWRMNNEIVRSGTAESSIILQRAGEGGESKILLTIDNKENVFQDALYSFNMFLNDK